MPGTMDSQCWARLCHIPRAPGLLRHPTLARGGFTFRDKVQMLLKHSHVSSVMDVGMDFNLSLSRTDLPNELLPGGRHA